MNTDSCNCGVPDENNLRQLEGFAKTLSTKTKLRILLILLSREHCVCEIQNCLDKEQSLISHHLSDMVNTGWIKQKIGKDARRVFYSLTKEGKGRLKIFLNIGGVNK